MRKSAPPEFDQYASRYELDLQQSIPASFTEDQYFAEYKIKYIARRIERLGFTKLLDYGCGVGRSLGLINKYFPDMELWGYDVSALSIEIAKQLSTKAHLTSNLDELPNFGLDVIFVANVFHHIPPDERVSAMAHCKTLLREGGRLFLFEHNPLNPVTRHIFERCPFDEEASMLRRSDALALAKAVGLRVVQSSYTLFFPRQVAFLRPVERMLGWLPLGAQYCVEIEK